jgi:RimJ/RimL family protein N-acetyltransferase
MAWDIATGPDAGMWTALQVGTFFVPGTEEAIGLKRRGEFVAGVIYEDWNGKSIVAHIAVAGRMTPTFLWAIFDYPFNVCGAHKVICPIPADNVRSIALATNMGFRQEARLADAAPSGDILLFTLIKSNCRFLKERHGKKETRTAADA